jgi:hypothetical protein
LFFLFFVFWFVFFFLFFGFFFWSHCNLRQGRLIITARFVAFREIVK